MALQGVCALTNCSEPNLVALPVSATAGTICIYNLLATGINVLCEVEAHRTPVVSCFVLLALTFQTSARLILVRVVPSYMEAHCHVQDFQQM